MNRKMMRAAALAGLALGAASATPVLSALNCAGVSQLLQRITANRPSVPAAVACTWKTMSLVSCAFIAKIAPGLSSMVTASSARPA